MSNVSTKIFEGGYWYLYSLCTFNVFFMRHTKGHIKVHQVVIMQCDYIILLNSNFNIKKCIKSLSIIISKDLSHQKILSLTDIINLLI